MLAGERLLPASCSGRGSTAVITCRGFRVRMCASSGRLSEVRRGPATPIKATLSTCARDLRGILLKKRWVRSSALKFSPGADEGGQAVSGLLRGPFASTTAAAGRDSEKKKGKSNRDKNGADSAQAAAAGDSQGSTKKLKKPKRSKPKTVAEIRSEHAKGEDKGATEGSADTEPLLAKLRRPFRRLVDAVNFGETLPVIGNNRISYARLLQLLNDKEVKRLVLMADGRYAMVEVPCEGWNAEMTDPDAIRFSRGSTPHFVEYNTRETPEWRMEKLRFYCEIPGDAYEDGLFMKLIKGNMAEHRLENDRVPYMNRLQADQVTLELQVVDPGSNFVWGAEYAPQILPILGLIALRGVVQAADWTLEKVGWLKRKDKREEVAEQVGRHTAQEFNVEAGRGPLGRGKSKKKSVGVTFRDVAGIEPVKGELEEILAMVMGSEKYQTMGVRAPRGILLEGPPGTGKTLLAKAMAGEKGIPFYAANGAEFVEMFQGVAAARIRSLFASARKNAQRGAIIFIDEIDAIGKARSNRIMDPGSQEREQGLLQLLVEMDGFNQNDRILVVAATNRIDVLDDALLRPGRFDRLIYMGLPAAPQREDILRVHARGKNVGEPGRAEGEGSQAHLLKRMSQLTPGFSGAELANLMNEAAIVSVRKRRDFIDYSALMAALEKIRLGLPGRKLVNSPAKRRLATMLAARAVAFAVNPCTPPVEQISMLPRGQAIARITYMPLDEGLTGGQWHLLAYAETREFSPAMREAAAVKAMPPFGTFGFLCKLLLPMMAGRACEEEFYGPDAATLSTSNDLAMALRLCHYLVADSLTDPGTIDTPVAWNLEYSGQPDPTTRSTEEMMEGRVAALHRAAYEEARELARDLRPAIEAVAAELLASETETVQGSRMVEIILDKCGPVIARLREASAGGGNTVLDRASDRYRRVAGAMMGLWGEAVPGWRDFPSRSGGESIIDFLELQGTQQEAEQRLASVKRFAMDPEGPFPLAPRQPALGDRADRATLAELAERMRPAEFVSMGN